MKTTERFEDLQVRLNQTALRMSERKQLRVEIHNFLEWNSNREMCEVIMDYCNSNNVSPETVEDIVRNSSRVKSMDEYPYWRIK